MKDCSIIPERTIGLDLGDRASYFVILDGSGRKEQEGKVGTREGNLQKVFSEFEPCRMALEVGTHSPWVVRVLRDLGHEVWVANPRELRLIYQNPNKDDRLDAESLARLARVDPQLLKPIEHRSLETAADLAQLKTRKKLVGVRSSLVNHCRGLVKPVGQRLPGCSTESFHKKVVGHIPEILAPALDPIVVEIGRLTEQIKRMDYQLVQVSRRYPQTTVMQQIKGVGPITALAYALIIEDPLRFSKSRQVGAYVGLCPGRRQSGKRDPQLRITKRGDKLLRSLLVSCAHYILGPFGEECDLRRFGLRLSQSGGKKAKRVATVAVARKLAVLMHHLWVSGQVYDPLYNQTLEAAA